MSRANSVRTPLASNAELGPAAEDEEVLDAHGHYMFRAVIGGLLYLAVSTRPDLSKPVGLLAQQMHAPTPSILHTRTRTSVSDRQRQRRHSLQLRWTFGSIIFSSLPLTLTGAVKRIPVDRPQGM